MKSEDIKTWAAETRLIDEKELRGSKHQRKIAPEIPKVQIRSWTLLHFQEPTNITVHSAKASIEWASSVEKPTGPEGAKDAEDLLQAEFESHILYMAEAVLKKHGMDLDNTISQLSKIMEFIQNAELRKNPPCL